MQNASGAREAVAILKNYLQQGFAIDSYMYVDVLQMCLKQRDLVSAKQVHECIMKSGMEQNSYVASNLLKVYIRCGRLQNARHIFDKLGNKNVYDWTTMIGGYAEHRHAKDAVELYNQMRQEGGQPNAVTYLSILKACSSPAALKWGKEIHVHITQGGFESDVRVGNALIHMYAKCGSINDARLVFGRMVKRDVITWTAMIGALALHGCVHEAFSLFLQMQTEDFVPNSTTYVSILNACTSTEALVWVKEVHRLAIEAGQELDLRVGNALVHTYAKCGSIADAKLVFGGMVERNVITWTSMIGGLAQHGYGREAFSLFLQMQREGFVPDTYTYVSILNACASAGALEWGREVHNHAVKAGLAFDLHVGSALIHMYAESGSIDDAIQVFDAMREPKIVTWNAIISALAKRGCGDEAFSRFLQMQREGFVPNAITYLSILNANASAGALEWVKEVHHHATKARLDVDVRVGSALVHMFTKSGSIGDARLVFDKMVERNVTTWNTMIGALAEHGSGQEAFSLFLQMQEERFVPDTYTYVSILSASASAGASEWVKEVHSHAAKANLAFDLRVGSALVRMYAKCGSIDDAKLVFDGMVDRDVITWTVMIAGLAQNGRGQEALRLFAEMISQGVKPNGITFVAVLSACCHAGLVNDGRYQFVSMTQDYGIEPTVVHYNCMVDIFGRAGLLAEAKYFILNMPMEPDVGTWGALLGACGRYCNLEMGVFAAKERLKLEPMNASTYVLLSNVYAAAGKWDQVSLVRSMMQGRGIRKEPGLSWIEIENHIHRFVVGDTSHPEFKEIYAELNDLDEKLKAEGYIPDTRLVLRNIDEEDKELALRCHSERLAITYGLMRLPLGKPIRIFKNLQVCVDCHTATKFISKVTGREIVARDANHFHHFKDGVCSCGDYW